MSAAFTRGPWEFECEEQRGARGYWLVADGDYLAMVCRRSAVEEETSNASLIAAAPELYEVGVRILECIDHPKARIRQLDIDALRAALAKARGQ